LFDTSSARVLQLLGGDSSDDAGCAVDSSSYVSSNEDEDSEFDPNDVYLMQKKSWMKGNVNKLVSTDDGHEQILCGVSGAGGKCTRLRSSCEKPNKKS
jgi:hypothetical protein